MPLPGFEPDYDLPKTNKEKGSGDFPYYPVKVSFLPYLCIDY
jgi:hypothetical protein